MKIKVKNSNQNSTKLIVPIDGEITIDKNGEFEVSEKCGNLLLVQKEVYELLDNSNANNLDPNKNDENQLILDGLKELSIEESIKLAKESNYPEKEWKKFSEKPKLMTAYLMSKFKESLSDTKTEDVKTKDVKVDPNQSAETDNEQA